MSTLQELLNLGLVEIGSDDSRFEKMQSASAALAAKFKEEPSVLVPATLVALDETTDENDPLFDLVEDMVASEWKTLRNTHVNRPRALLRSIIIDAIANSVVDDAQTAAVVWNTAVSPVRHQQVRLGKASSVLEGILTGAGQLAEQEAVVRAGFVASAPKKRRRKAPS
ncbi:MAG TPA: GTPase-associated system all-helical protein GASH, partial [Enhygromyxa sp.]|nr:GTPase-associated system all-helical protein GASH [Enhygromyxa sp.]